MLTLYGPLSSCCRADSIKAVIADPNSPGGIGERGPTVVRLAWHSSGSYDKVTKTNGSNGATMRFKEELGHGANNGASRRRRKEDFVRITSSAPQAWTSRWRGWRR